MPSESTHRSPWDDCVVVDTGNPRPFNSHKPTMRQLEADLEHQEKTLHSTMRAARDFTRLMQDAKDRNLLTEQQMSDGLKVRRQWIIDADDSYERAEARMAEARMEQALNSAIDDPGIDAGPAFLALECSHGIDENVERHESSLPETASPPQAHHAAATTPSAPQVELNRYGVKPNPARQIKAARRRRNWALRKSAPEVYEVVMEEKKRHRDEHLREQRRRKHGG
ncbi:hypothetical protein PFICI_04064 [Pestalotiopsis fici W106-1]|uniref:Uncharacterized protein n=1 Tax=Pestalotiopsis fici (strain W106-1 / CGMCC3.15140) TaxID=1229662 RepID=W3XJ41_PESFW|nr:uncharacterized protein PFICI_04064 [Pestalotiopsis fici W106-1]ETS86039.1 hypothetical protein PFICI_04064 [Pestalotiopsis fici W106-1]